MAANSQFVWSHKPVILSVSGSLLTVPFWLNKRTLAVANSVAHVYLVRVQSSHSGGLVSHVVSGKLRIMCSLYLHTTLTTPMVWKLRLHTDPRVKKLHCALTTGTSAKCVVFAKFYNWQSTESQNIYQATINPDFLVPKKFCTLVMEVLLCKTCSVHVPVHTLCLRKGNHIYIYESAGL